MGLVQSWLADATARAVREPRALALATADRRGRASNRIVAITSVDDRSLVFTTHTGSQKGREMAATSWASGLLYWRGTGQQIILSGPAPPGSAAQADAPWYAPPPPLPATSTGPPPSAPGPNPAQLRAQAD